MNMRLKAMLVLLVFVAVVALPFSIAAAGGHFFNGIPMPEISGSPQVESVAADGYGAAAMEEYAQNLPKPAAAAASLAKQIDLDDMRNHMNILKKEGRSTNECLGCHSNKEQFCDRCHGYVGINPTFDPRN